MTEIEVKIYRPMVERVARQYTQTGEPMADLMQDGYLALLEYEKRQGSLPSPDDATLHRYLRQAVSQSAYGHAYTVRVPRRVAEPLNHQIADSLTPELQERYAMGEETVWEEREQRAEKLTTSLKKLSKRQKKVVQIIYGLGNGRQQTEQQAAQHLHLTVNATNHLHLRALRRLQKKMAE